MENEGNISSGYYINGAKVAEASVSLKTFYLSLKDTNDIIEKLKNPEDYNFSSTINTIKTKFTEIYDTSSNFVTSLEERIEAKMTDADFAKDYIDFVQILGAKNLNGELSEEEMKACELEYLMFNNIAVKSEYEVLLAKEKSGEKLTQEEIRRKDELALTIEIYEKTKEITKSGIREDPDIVVLYMERNELQQKVVENKYKPIKTQLDYLYMDLQLTTDPDVRKELQNEIDKLELELINEKIEKLELSKAPDLSSSYDVSKIPDDHEYWKYFGNKKTYIDAYECVRETDGYNHIDVDEYNKNIDKQITELKLQMGEKGVKIWGYEQERNAKIANTDYFTQEARENANNKAIASEYYAAYYANMLTIAKIEQEKSKIKDEKSYDYEELTKKQLTLKEYLITGKPEILKTGSEEYELSQIEWAKENVSKYNEIQLTKPTTTYYEDNTIFSYRQQMEIADRNEFNNMSGWEKTVQRGETFALSFAQGSAEVFGQWADGVVMISSLGGSNEYKKRVTHYVSRDIVEEWYDESVAHLNGDIAYGKWHSTGQFTGTVLTEAGLQIAYTYSGAGLPAAALTYGIKGMGKSSEKALQSGATYWGAVGAGTLTFGVETASAYGLYSSQVNPPKPVTYKYLDKAGEVKEFAIQAPLTLGQKNIIGAAKEYANEGITMFYDGEYDLWGATKNAGVVIASNAVSEYVYKPLLTKKIVSGEEEIVIDEVGNTEKVNMLKLEKREFKAGSDKMAQKITDKTYGRAIEAVDRTSKTFQIPNAGIEQVSRNDLSETIAFIYDKTSQKYLKDYTKNKMKELVK